MKYSIHYTMTLPGKLIAVFALLMLVSCEKVIDLDLNDAEKKNVIEANITDRAGDARVVISETKNFDEDNIFTGISGATVTITESGGATTTLNEVTTGVYESSGLVAVPGKTYTLNVNVNGTNYSAISVMPQKVNMDTIFVTNEFLFTQFQKIVNVEFQDPPGRGNNYRFIQYINGVKEDQAIVQNDDYTDGRNVNNKLFYFADDDEEDETKIESGDTVRVEFLCIDAAMYKYWYSLERSATGIGGQATPSNPVSNMQGGALGYFSAHTFQTKTMIVP